MCGGTCGSHHAASKAPGLSPRVRGNLDFLVVDYLQLRSIPACAGEPHRRPARRISARVYPRVCGGTRRPGPRPRPASGLSPRVRGNHGNAHRRRAYQRSIPACAGEPMPGAGVHSRSRVYPRVCGGTRRTGAGTPPRKGLSPRVRGNRLTPAKPARRERSIPACAGEPDPEMEVKRYGKVYPRVCGGTARERVAGTNPDGLSPRVRGNPTSQPVCAQWIGSIPACAGEPRRYGLDQHQPEVYPRVCGGT